MWRNFFFSSMLQNTSLHFLSGNFKERLKGRSRKCSIWYIECSERRPRADTVKVFVLGPLTVSRGGTALNVSNLWPRRDHVSPTYINRHDKTVR